MAPLRRPPPRPDRRVAPLVALALALAACSSAGFDGNVYRDAGLRFRVGPIPPGWHRIEAEGARLAFRDEATSATTMVNARCGADADDAPLKALTGHLFLLFTDREIASQETLMLDGREALHTVATAKLDGVSRAFDVYVLKKDGCVYDFVQIAPPESGGALRGPFERFVTGFHALEAGAR
jgi:hypothetical protein